jgi:hypothetical protein
MSVKIMAKKKQEDSITKGLCLVCGKPPLKTERISKEKDFVCSKCTQYLLEHPRKSGESIEEVLNVKAREARV